MDFSGDVWALIGTFLAIAITLARFTSTKIDKLQEDAVDLKVEVAVLQEKVQKLEDANRHNAGYAQTSGSGAAGVIPLPRKSQKAE